MIEPKVLISISLSVLLSRNLTDPKRTWNPFTKEFIADKTPFIDRIAFDSSQNISGLYLGRVKI